MVAAYVPLVRRKERDSKLLGFPLIVRRLKDPSTKSPALIVIVLAGFAIPPVITSAMNGASQANAQCNQLEAKASIEWDRRKMSKCLGGEIQSPKCLPRTVPQWARCNVSVCPEDYQKV